jgi:site-specific recombinase XerD
MSRDPITPVDPDEALTKYLQHRSNEVSEATLNAHRYRLQHFVRYCQEEGITALSELAGRDLQDYRYWRQQDGDLNLVTVHTQMATLRVFMKWAASYDAVPEGMHAKVRVPDLPRDADVNDDMIEAEAAFDILEYLKMYEYASKRHVMFSILWFTGMRMGAVRGIDLGDIERDKRGAYIDLKHRPEQDTPLKNKAQGERPVAIHDKRYELIQDYIKARREDHTDEYGREPLLTTVYGRVGKGTFRQWTYEVTHPCFWNYGACPHDREMDECEALEGSRAASKCPSALSPHAIRRGSITYWLSEDTSQDAVSERMNVNEQALEKHYDNRTEKQKMDQRRDEFF